MAREGMADSDLDFSISRLGPCRVSSPMTGVQFVDDDRQVLVNARLDELKPWLEQRLEPPSMESAGPRRHLFFDPSTLACGIVTCGGLCPGLNDVIRAIVLSLHHHYGVNKVYGFRFGYEGLVRRYGHEPIDLTPARINRIHEIGGSVLGSSRGPQDPVEMVRTLRALNVGILFAIGGDGTLRGAQAISDQATCEGAELAVIGIPKTIDNDISFVQKTFGFETAVTEARRSIYAANAEAEAARNGIGLVKLMGRDSGFIAAYAVLAASHVNYCLIPEVRFTLEHLLPELRARVARRGHAVVVVAEGAGQDLFAATHERDASGNVKYGDIGVLLKNEIAADLARHGVQGSVKYIDPSYEIRSVTASAHDSAFCLLLGHCAVHAGMTGRTNMVVSFWNHRFTHVPISLAASERKRIDPDGELWSAVLAATGQPRELC